jgi:hypothetical protein
MVEWLRRRWKPIAGAAGAVALVAVVVWMVNGAAGPRSTAQQETAGRQVTLNTGAEPAEQARITTVRDMLARLPDDLVAGRSESLAAPLKGRVAEVATVWKPAATTALDPGSWWRTGDVATVVATVTAGGDSARLWLTVSFEGGAWRLAGADRMRS